MTLKKRLPADTRQAVKKAWGVVTAQTMSRVLTALHEQCPSNLVKLVQSAINEVLTNVKKPTEAQVHSNNFKLSHHIHCVMKCQMCSANLDLLSFLLYVNDHLIKMSLSDIVVKIAKLQ